MLPDQRGLLARRVLQRFGSDLRGHVFAIRGLAFKPETDDLREAPSLQVIETLLAHGAQVRAYDPTAMPRLFALWGERPGLMLVEDAMAAAAGASALLLLTEWREFRSPDYAGLKELLRTPLVIDGRNIYEPEVLAAFELETIGIGRRNLTQAALAVPEMPRLPRAA